MDINIKSGATIAMIKVGAKFRSIASPSSGPPGPNEFNTAVMSITPSADGVVPEIEKIRA